MSFIEVFQQIINEKGFIDLFREPHDLIRYYRGFLDDIIKWGYNDYLIEFDNDIFFRELIENLLEDKRLSPYPELSEFRKEVNGLDDKLRQLFIPGYERPKASGWWEKGILKNGSSLYFEDIRKYYGFNLYP